MFCKVTANTESRYIEPLLLGETGLGSYEPLVTIFSLTNIYIALFYMFLFKDTLFNIYCWFILNSWPTAGLSKTLIFPIRLITACLHLGTVDRTSALSLRAMLNSKITQKRHKNVKNMALNRLQKGHSWTVRGAEKRRQSVTLFNVSWNMCLRQLPVSSPVHIYAGLQKQWVLIWRLQINSVSR